MPIEMAERQAIKWMGKSCRRRQILTTSQVSFAQKEEIVEPALFVARLIAFVGVKLAIAQALDHFALLARVPEGSLLLVAQLFQARKLMLENWPLLEEGGFPQQCEVQFGAG